MRESAAQRSTARSSPTRNVRAGDGAPPSRVTCACTLEHVGGVSQAPPTRIFISYRRDDSSGHAGRLYDDLVERFGDDRVFIDIDTIEPGVDFSESIERALDSCEIVLAVIGKSWLKISDSAGLRRLDHPDDYVRMELEAALARGVRVIPVRVQGAEMPSSTELPEGLASLARRQAVELSDSRWRYDVSVLVSAVERVAAESLARTTERDEPGQEVPEPHGDGMEDRLHDGVGPDRQRRATVAESEQEGIDRRGEDLETNPKAGPPRGATTPAPGDPTGPTVGGTEVESGRRSRGRWFLVAGGAVLLGLAAVAAAMVLGGGRDGQGDGDAGARTNRTNRTAEGRETRTVGLTERLIPPESPYRCVSPFHRDHDGRMTLHLQFASGTSLEFASRDPSDTTDAFLFCGGTASHDIPGLASAPLTFSSPAPGSVVESISGVYGRDFDPGGEDRRISLTTEVAGADVCSSRTDEAGHARRFTCNLPADTKLEEVVLRFVVERDRPLGVFAGIANLRASFVS